MIHLVMAVKANARLNGRDTVTIEDVREMAPFVLRHRISVAPGMSVDTVLLHRETNGTGANSADASKVWVNANIQITPASDTNPVGTPVSTGGILAQGARSVIVLREVKP